MTQILYIHTHAYTLHDRHNKNTHALEDKMTHSLVHFKASSDEIHPTLYANIGFNGFQNKFD